MANLITAVMWIVIGALCSITAKKNGKNPYTWFFIGLFFGIFGFIALLLTKMVRRKATKAPSLAPAASAMLPVSLPHQNWYYLEGTTEQKGPVSLKCIIDLKEKGIITDSTLLWNECTVSWKKLEEVLGIEKAPQ